MTDLARPCPTPQQRTVDGQTVAQELTTTDHPQGGFLPGPFDSAQQIQDDIHRMLDESGSTSTGQSRSEADRG